MNNYLDILLHFVSVIIGAAISWFSSYYVWRRQNRSRDLKIALSEIKSLSFAIFKVRLKENFGKIETEGLLPKLTSCYLELFCIVPYFRSKSKIEIETMLEIVSHLEDLIIGAFEDENEIEKNTKQLNDLLCRYLTTEKKVLHILIKNNSK